MVSVVEDVNIILFVCDCAVSHVYIMKSMEP